MAIKEKDRYLIDGVGCLTAHVVDCVLVTEPVGAFHLTNQPHKYIHYLGEINKDAYRVVHVPSPVVFGHVL
jgi:hypothetical protein